MNQSYKLGSGRDLSCKSHHGVIPIFRVIFQSRFYAFLFLLPEHPLERDAKVIALNGAFCIEYFRIPKCPIFFFCTAIVIISQ